MFRTAAAGVCLFLLAVPKAGDRPPQSRVDADWVMAPKDYANTRFSGLDEINAGNAKNLKLAWTFSCRLGPGGPDRQFMRPQLRSGGLSYGGR
ncbi:MAG TPA: hypothetical protein VN442_09125 [Bryobacteraceae bacterium]|nr:hypothetical protein [Bryobacteraceae bacterium]